MRADPNLCFFCLGSLNTGAGYLIYFHKDIKIGYKIHYKCQFYIFLYPVFSDQTQFKAFSGNKKPGFLCCQRHSGFFRFRIHPGVFMHFLLGF